jgi:hypothetical protein
MALFAIIDDDNLVTNVIEHNKGYDVTDPEHIIPIEEGTVVGPGDTYDPETGHFIDPKPFDSWVWRETMVEGTYSWFAPIDPPEDMGDDDGNGGMISYSWDEDNQEWILDT